jgi:predicted nucleic acid-binding protein
MNGTPVIPDDTLNAWYKLNDGPRSFHIDAEAARHEPRFVSLVSSREPTPNLWTDAWLAALAISLDCGIATFDRRFKSFGWIVTRVSQRSP